MYRRRALLVVAGVLVLLLTSGCKEIPAFADRAWQESAYLGISPERLRVVLRPLALLAIPAVLGAARALWKEEIDSLDIGHWGGILLLVSLFPFFIPLLSLLGRNGFWPSYLSFNWIMSQMDWSLPGDDWPERFAIALTAVGPFFYALWEWVVFGIHTLMVFVTVSVRNTKPLTISTATILLWLVTPSIAVGGGVVIMNSFRDNAILSSDPFDPVFNLGYIVVVLVTAAILLIVAPFVTAMFAIFFSRFPHRSWGEEKEREEEERERRRGIDLGGLAGGAEEKTDGKHNRLSSSLLSAIEPNLPTGKRVTFEKFLRPYHPQNHLVLPDQASFHLTREKALRMTQSIFLRLTKENLEPIFQKIPTKKERKKPKTSRQSWSMNLAGLLP